MACRDYIGGKSVYFRPVPAIQAFLILLVLLNIVVFGFRWFFVTQLWIRHLFFFRKNGFLDLNEPIMLFQIKMIIIIVLHDLVHKLITYFYFARYKPRLLTAVVEIVGSHSLN